MVISIEKAREEMEKHPPEASRSAVYELMQHFPKGITPKAIEQGTGLKLGSVRVQLSKLKKAGIAINSTKHKGLWKLIETA